jgi:hypothetical protein
MTLAGTAGHPALGRPEAWAAAGNPYWTRLRKGGVVMTVNQNVPVSFRLCCPAKRAYQFLRPVEGAAGWSVNEMDARGGSGDQWELNLRLRPGTYRVRYYVHDGRRIVYWEPTDTAGVRFDGMDAVIDVPLRTHRHTAIAVGVSPP